MSKPTPGAPRPKARSSRTRASGRRTFSVGRALADTFSIWMGKLLPFTLLTLVVFAPFVLMQYLSMVALAPVTQAPWWQALDSAIAGICGAILNAAVIHTVFQRLRGASVSFGESVARGFAKLPAVVGVSLLIGGLTLVLVLPGVALSFAGGPSVAGLAASLGGLVLLIVNCGLYVAVPSCVVERLGAVRALKRSWGLTRGSKFQIFLILVLFGLITLAGTAALVGTTVVVADESFVNDAQTSMPTFLALMVLQLTLASLQAVLVTVVYHDLRMMKEGIGAEDLADVFA